jgi:predicted SAM-dependent methyltransferase
MSAKWRLGPIKGIYVHSVLFEWRHGIGNRRLIAACKRADQLKLHLGCGSRLLPGWLNIDIQKRADGVAVLRMPVGLRRFTDCSISYVYCSHMIEHIGYPGEVQTLAREIHRILIPGGVLRFVVPGIERIIRAYVADDKEFFAQQEKFHPSWCTTKMEHLMYALQQDGEHKYGYDFETAHKFLADAGFSRICHSQHNQSEYESLRIDYRGENLSLFVEAVK